MELMHHNVLRVNAPVALTDEQMAILHDQGWRAGKHKDTDPDDPAEVPRVLPETDVESDPEATPRRTRTRAKATAKATRKD